MEVNMGDRAQIAIKDSGTDRRVYLYTHWTGSELIPTLRRALARKQRWDDSCYLTRIIFCEMVKGDENSETGFGIDTAQHGDVYYKIPVLDCDTQMISWENTRGKDIPPVSFAAFIAQPDDEGDED
jgi:hypothetical protein